MKSFRVIVAVAALFSAAFGWSLPVVSAGAGCVALLLLTTSCAGPNVTGIVIQRGTRHSQGGAQTPSAVVLEETPPLPLDPTGPGADPDPDPLVPLDPIEEGSGAPVPPVR